MTFPLTKNVCISTIYDGTFINNVPECCTVGEKLSVLHSMYKRVNLFKNDLLKRLYKVEA